MVGFKGETSEELLESAESSVCLELKDFQRGIDFLKSEGVKKAFMAGTVAHTNLFKLPKLDSLAGRLLSSLADKRADTLLKAAAAWLKRSGVYVVSPMDYLGPLLPERGVLTRRVPSEEEWRDIKFGRWAAKKIAGLDFGQTVVVKQQAVLAVEALEGTDEAIRRGGKLGNGGVVVVKVSKPKQDFRFDVPVIGLKTVDSLKEARAQVLAVEAGKTIALERPRLVSAADEAGLSIVAV